MTGTRSTEEGAAAPGEGLSVLVVDEDATVREAIAGYAERRYDNLRVLEGTDLRDALDRIEDGSLDCLVADPDLLGDGGEEPLEALAERESVPPVVWLTDRDPSALDDGLYEVGTTIVEKGDDRLEWSFLFEKVRGAIQHDAVGDRDRDLFRTLVESASDGLYTLDATGRVIYLNEAFADILGYDQAELFGVHAATVMADGELERGQQLIQELLETDDRETDIMDMRMVRRDGTPITVAVHFRVLTTPEGTYDGVLGVVRDVTDRRRQERELQRQRDRLEEFASVVGHDLQTPLTVAKGRLELALENHEDQHQDQDLEAAAEALDRMEGLLTDLLDLARQGEMVESLEPVDLEAVATDAWRDVASAGSGDNRLDVDDQRVRADADRLRQLFENLFRNALDHAGPDVTVTVGPLPDRPGFYVADDGRGLPDGVDEAVFDRGYTTGEGGSGFGLAIVKRIVEAHHWEIAVGESASGGARFEVTVDP